MYSLNHCVCRACRAYEQSMCSGYSTLRCTALRHVIIPFEIVLQEDTRSCRRLAVRTSRELAQQSPCIGPMAKAMTARQPALLLGARCMLWTLIVISFLCFFWALFVRPTAWYSNSAGFATTSAALEVPLHALEKQVKNVDAPVVDGSIMFMVRHAT